MTSNWTIVFSSACDSTSTMPGLSILNVGSVVAAPYESLDVGVGVDVDLALGVGLDHRLHGLGADVNLDPVACWG